MNEPEHEFSLARKAVDEIEKARGNFRLFRVAIIVAFSVLVLQLANLQIAQGEYYRQVADQNRYRLVETDALRGIIYDREGRILTRNIPSFNVSLIPADLPDGDAELEHILQTLSLLLGVPLETIVENNALDIVGKLPVDLGRPVSAPRRKPGLRELVKNGYRDPFTPIPIKSNVPREIAFYLEEKHLDLPGVQVGLEPVREYPTAELMAHIIGYVGRIPREQFEEYREIGYAPADQVGLTGLEYAFERDLRGKKGTRYIAVDVAGREVNRYGEDLPIPGANLILTLDSEFQRSVEKILTRALRGARAKQGVAIVLDPRNGEVVAMVSLPSYDNNLFATGIAAEDYLALAQDPLRPLVNHAITGQYPPGSVFKLIPASAALQEKTVEANARVETPGIIWVPHKYFPDDLSQAQPFYDWDKRGFGALNLREGIMLSSDIYFYKLVGGEYPNFDTGLGVERLAAYMRLFGIGETTGIDLPGEASGLAPDPEWKRKTIGDVWTTGDTYNMAIGQGYVLSTPLQVAQFTAAVANGGRLYKPQLVLAITDANGALTRKIQPELIRQIPIDGLNLAIVQEGMRLAVTRGTAVKANLADVSVAAKTGTAEYYGPKVNGHLPTHAWFTAFAPYENPQVVVTVFVAGGGEGSEVAAPAATEILRAYFRLPDNAPIAAPQQPLTPPVSARPPTTRGTPYKYAARLLGVDAGGELPGIFGTVVDAHGRGVNGVHVVADKCDGHPVFREVTDSNGAFNFKGVYWKDSLRWCVRTVAPGDSEPLTIQVEPYRRYIVQFAPTQ